MSEVVEMPVDRPSGELLLREAIIAYKAGNKPKARFLLDLAARQAPHNELVWLWRAYIARTRSAAQEYVEEVLRINPNSAKALEWYAKLQPMPSAPPTAHWECPLCRQRSPGTQKRCPYCQAIVDLDDIDAFLTNDGVQRDVMRAAVERIQSSPSSAGDAESLVHLALAHLNLMQSNEALIHLRKAAQLRPDDTVIINAVKQLLSRRQVMVVDDSPTVRTAVSGVLERNRFRPVAAEDGFDALARLNEEIPDVIILDIKMPKMDGYQVCKVLKANQQTRHVPVIMLSASMIDKVRGRMVGAVEFISKPFRSEELLKLIGRHIPQSDTQPHTLLGV